MATKKTVTKTVKKIPTTVKIEGGQASFYSNDDLPPRRERALRIAVATLNWAKARRIETAQRILAEDGAELDASGVLPGDDVVFTKAEAAEWAELGDVASWAYLKSWTLMESHINGETTTLTPRPLPADPDEFLDLPRGIYTPITAAAAELLGEFMRAQDDFTVDGGAGDDDSPTGL